MDWAARLHTAAHSSFPEKSSAAIRSAASISDSFTLANSIRLRLSRRLAFLGRRRCAFTAAAGPPRTGV